MKKENQLPVPVLTEHENGDIRYTFCTEHVEHLANLGLIPKEIADYFFKQQEQSKVMSQKIKKFQENNPNPSLETWQSFFGVPRTLTLEEMAQSKNEADMQIQFHEILKKNWNALTARLHQISNPEDEQKSLFKNISSEENFGISRMIADVVYHIQTMLSTAELKNTFENQYEAKGSIKNSLGDSIGLTYTFQASSQEDANKIFENYKNILLKKGMKIWLAHWAMTNTIGGFEYNCPMIEIMKLISDEERESTFSVKEKQEHWAITKMLGMTKLTRERIVKKRGTKSNTIRWIEQPLLEIMGGEKEEETPEKYPTMIAVRVLAPRTDNKGFVAAVYKNQTLKLNPDDSFLAFVIQTRASQMNRGEKDLHFNWDWLFENGNLQATANKKRAVAKAQARKKMDRFKEHQIIDNWDEELLGVRITPKPQRKKKQKK